MLKEAVTIVDFSKNERMIFESVPGKQVTLAHIISNPDQRIFTKLGIPEEQFSNAIGLITITPSDMAIIAVDRAKKEAAVDIAFIDRFSGAVCILGDVAAVEAAMRGTCDMLAKMNYTVCKLTRS